MASSTPSLIVRYDLGYTAVAVGGGLSAPPSGIDDRINSTIVGPVDRPQTVTMDLPSGYTFVHNGGCDTFSAHGNSDTCNRTSAGSGSVKASLITCASGNDEASRTLTNTFL